MSTLKQIVLHDTTREVADLQCRHCGEFYLVGIAPEYKTSWKLYRHPKHDLIEASYPEFRKFLELRPYLVMFVLQQLEGIICPKCGRHAGMKWTYCSRFHPYALLRSLTPAETCYQPR